MVRTTALLFFLSISSAGAQAQPPIPVLFHRGDANQDGEMDLTDAIFVLDVLFLGDQEAACLKAIDNDDNGELDLTDIIFLLSHLFLDGRAPFEPFPHCGIDPTEDSLTCEAHTLCDFESVVSAYSTLQTIAGKGESDNSNEWESSFEGGAATEAELSRPHFAMGDDGGNIYIADKEAHAIRKVTPDGKIFTVAGTNQPGDDGDEPGPGTERRLSNPNGIWVRGDSTVYILDLDNGKVRRLDPSGEMTTLFTDPEGIIVGRGLWVSDDESLAYYASNSAVKKWTPQGGIEVFSSGFTSLGNIAMDPGGNLVAADRFGNRVYRIAADGTATPIAGNGESWGGGDGESALGTGIAGVRGIWFLPHGGYFLATHQGSQVWYIDTGGTIHLFLDGRNDDQSHSGDGEHFRTPGYKISEARSISVDVAGNILVVENDLGFVRRILRR